MKINRSFARILATLMAGAFLATIAITGVQSPVQAQQHHKKNILQKHPMLSSIAAGAATYHALKVTGKNRAAHGGKRNFAQRHPMLSGIAAAGVTHHMIKKSMKHKQ